MFLKKKLKNLRSLKLIGGSLNPFLREGDLLFLDVSYKKINNYDLVSFLKGNDLITHIALWKKDKLFLVPLNINYYDVPINLGSIFGKVIWVKKGKIYLPIFLFKLLFFLYFKVKKIK